MTTFSIVLTYWDRPNMLSRALYCLAQQTYANFEVVPIFDGYSHHGLRVYNQFRKGREDKFRHPIVFEEGRAEHYGNACRRHALASCRGDYVLWYGHGDLIDKDYLETHAQQIQDDMCISVVGQHHFSNHNNQGNYISYRGVLPHTGVELKLGGLDLLQYAVPLYAATRWAFPEEHWATYEADWMTFDSIRQNEPGLEVRVNPVPVCGHF